MKRFSPHHIGVDAHNGQMDGYFFVVMPDHPYATKRTGRVLLHRLLMENMLGRYLRPNEVVHHVDGDRHNNNLDNLEVMSVADHCRRHRSPPPRRKCAGCGRIFTVTIYVKNSHRYSSMKYCSQDCRENKKRAAISKSCKKHTAAKTNKSNGVCLQCGRDLPAHLTHYCSADCAHIANRVVPRPTASKLKQLIWAMPTELIGKQFGVTGKAVEKWCKIYRINKPPRGYWAKRYANRKQIENSTISFGD